MAVELFVTGDDRVLVNELALRTHNTGHLHTEASTTSQFEQHLRAVLGPAPGAHDAGCRAAAMVNIVGSERRLGSGVAPRRRVVRAGGTRTPVRQERSAGT